MRGVKRVTSGINEKGLIVVSAAASSVGREGKVTTVGKILSEASSVDEVTAMLRKGRFKGRSITWWEIFIRLFFSK